MELMFKDGKTATGVVSYDWKAKMFSSSFTKKYPVAVRYPRRTRKLMKPIAVRDDSTCPHEEAFRLQKNEERYITMATMIPLAILLLPAFVMIVYLILNPDAFMVPFAP